MPKGQIHGKIQTGNEIHDINVPIFMWVEDQIHFYFSPSLDLSGYGKTDTEALQSFEYSLEEFVKYASHKKVLHKELTRLGWKVNIKKKKFASPEPGFLESKNDSYRELINKPGVVTGNRKVALAF